MSKKTYVLYHKSCWDGYGAAYAAWLRLGDNAEYIAAQYGEAPPAVDWRGKTVYLLDFSYDRPTLDMIAAQADLVLVLDHHKTAEQALEGFQHAIFDQSHSGAVLAWNYFHEGVELPTMLRYIEDRDLWRHQLTDSEAYNAALRTYPLTFDGWNEISTWPVIDLIYQGKQILREQQRIIESHVRHAVMQNFHGHMVPMTNATTLNSEIAHALCKAFPEAPFSVTYFITERPRQIVYSMRRGGGDFDLGAFAKEHGGGGHAAAASFSKPLEF